MASIDRAREADTEQITNRYRVAREDLAELAECREIDLVSAVCTVLRAAAQTSGEGS